MRVECRMNKNIQGFLTVPLAIIIAGVIVGLSVIYAVGQNARPVDAGGDAVVEDIEGGGVSASLDNVRPIDAEDHILGNIDAPVKIIEYSDTECPFCKRFHFTMKDVVKFYGDKVAWVYRNFPLESLHSQARKEAEALECAGSVGGNVKFWTFMDRLMEVTPSNDGLDLSELPKIAAYAGINVAKFNECLESGRMAERVERDYQNATDAGGQGTPFNIVIGPDGAKYPVEGAYPLNEMKKIIDKALRTRS